MMFLFCLVAATWPRGPGQDAPSARAKAAKTDVAHTLERALAPDLEALVVAADLMESGDIGDWREFERRLGAAGRSSGRVIGWAPRIGGGDRARFEDDSGKSAYRSFRVLELGEGRTTRPAADRDVYFPVTFFDHLSQDHGLRLGLDLGSLPGLHALYARADVPATGHLVRHGDAILAVLPVFAPARRGQRHATLLGLVFTLGPALRLADR